jgi:hypothetical protein
VRRLRPYDWPAVTPGLQIETFADCWSAVVGSDKLAKVRQISVGRAIGELTTIDKGLAPGEQVVVDGQSRLTPDAHVDVKSSMGGGTSGRAATTQAGAVR